MNVLGPSPILEKVGVEVPSIEPFRFGSHVAPVPNWCPVPVGAPCHQPVHEQLQGVLLLGRINRHLEFPDRVLCDEVAIARIDRVGVAAEHREASDKRWSSGVQGRSAVSLVNEWTSLMKERNLGELITVLLGTDHRSIDMRQVSPSVGVLSQEERVEAIGRAR